MPDVEVPVLIVGGGLSGLASALFLRQHGIDCRLVERNTTTSQLLRSTHVSPRTMELFRTVGIQQAVWDVAEKVVLGKYWSRTDLPPRQLPRAILRANSLADVVAGNVVVMEEGANLFTNVGPVEPVWCGQDRVEPIMLREARRRGAHIDFNTEMLSFTADADGVSARVRDRATGEETSVRAKYLIGADGAGGKIRTELGIERRGNGTVGHVLTVLFKADLDAILGGRRFLILYLSHPEAAGMLFKLDDERWILRLVLRPRADRGGPGLGRRVCGPDPQGDRRAAALRRHPHDHGLVDGPRARRQLPLRPGLPHRRRLPCAAAHRRVRVVALSAPRDEAFLTGLGAVFVPRSDDPARALRAVAPQGVDGLVDGASLGDRVLPAVRDGGGFVAVRPPATPVPQRGIRTMPVITRGDGAQLRSLVDLVDKGRLTLRVGRTFLYEEAHLAHEQLDRGGQRGRLVLLP